MQRDSQLEGGNLLLLVQRSYKEIKRLFREPLVVLSVYVSVPTTSR
jgi:hypothetical protein